MEPLSFCIISSEQEEFLPTYLFFESSSQMKLLSEIFSCLDFINNFYSNKLNNCLKNNIYISIIFK